MARLLLVIFCIYDVNDEALSNSLVFCSVNFPCMVGLPARMTSLKYERATQLGHWLAVSLEVHSPPTTPL